MVILDTKVTPKSFSLEVTRSNIVMCEVLWYRVTSSQLFDLTLPRMNKPTCTLPWNVYNIKFEQKKDIVYETTNEYMLDMVLFMEMMLSCEDHTTFIYCHSWEQRSLV